MLTPAARKYWETIRNLATKELAEGEEKTPEPIPWSELQRAFTSCIGGDGECHHAARRVLKVVEEQVVPWLKRWGTDQVAGSVLAALDKARTPGA